MKSLFIQNSNYSNPYYVALRDQERNKKLRDQVEELWNKFQPYADPRFRESFAENIDARFWEMYLVSCLIRNGFNLLPKTTSDGPDIHINHNNIDIWIEAIVPTRGDGPDAVPLLDEKPSYEPLPEEKIILRFTNAIAEKARKYNHYIKTGLIRAADPFIIAINGGGIELLIFECSMPLIIKAVYPFGNYQITIDTNTLDTIREGYANRKTINKKSNAKVETDIFLNTKYSGISGILYSGASLRDIPTNPGKELLFIHNSVTSSPLPIGWLRSENEYYLKDGSLVKVDAKFLNQQ